MPPPSQSLIPHRGIRFLSQVLHHHLSQGGLAHISHPNVVLQTALIDVKNALHALMLKNQKSSALSTEQIDLAQTVSALHTPTGKAEVLTLWKTIVQRRALQSIPLGKTLKQRLKTFQMLKQQKKDAEIVQTLRALFPNIGVMPDALHVQVYSQEPGFNNLAAELGAGHLLVRRAYLERVPPAFRIGSLSSGVSWITLDMVPEGIQAWPYISFRAFVLTYTFGSFEQNKRVLLINAQTRQGVWYTNQSEAKKGLVAAGVLSKTVIQGIPFAMGSTLSFTKWK